MKTQAAWVLIALFPVVIAGSLLLRRRIPPIWMLLGACVLGLLGGVVARREPLQELTTARWQESRDRWNQRGPKSYDLELLVHADRLDDGRFALQVRNGHVVSATRNGLRTTGAEEGYSVPALFEMLERELELAQHPQVGFGAPEGYRVYLRVRFHPDLGYPELYRRIVGGASNGVEIRVTRLTPAG